MRLLKFIHIFWYFFSNCLALPADSDSGLGRIGYLGSTAKAENFDDDQMIIFAVFLKKDYWRDSKKIGEIETIFRNVIEPNNPAPSDIWAAQYKAVGTPFILIRGKYQLLAYFMLAESQADPSKVVQYLSTWNALETGLDLLQRIEKYDQTKYPSISPGNDKRKRDLDKTRKPELDATTSESQVNIEDQDFQKRAIELWNQPLTPDIKFYSKPPDVAPEDYHNVYYEASQGENINIFVLDTGFADHADQLVTLKHAFQNGQIKGWLLPGGPLATAEHRENRKVAKEWVYHGTLVISKIIDEGVGFARKANIWVGGGYDSADNDFEIFILDLLFQTLEKIDEETEKDPGFKAIINLSTIIGIHRVGDVLSEYPTSVLTEKEREYIEVLSELLDIVLDSLGKRENVIIVTGSGNGWRGRPIDGRADFPAKRGGTIDNLVVVGSGDALGNLVSWSKADFIKVYGLSEGVVVPDFEEGPNGEQIPVEPPQNSLDEGISYGKTLATFSFSYLKLAMLSIPIFLKLKCYVHLANFLCHYNARGNQANPVICSILANHLSANPSWSTKQAIDKLYSDAYWRGGDDEDIKLAWTGASEPPDDFDDMDCDDETDDSDDFDSDPMDIGKRALKHYNEMHRRDICSQARKNNSQSENFTITGGPYLATKTLLLLVTHQTILQTTLKTVTATKTALITKETEITHTVAVSKAI
ncbi:hypothetical protein TWF694_007760 [Orbilia ellipsospora]|uniref:Peptidase S8/S53 domain-containing protein n=1 Tax=Orbilia ellipsospora TaxID=2528407 RepID=A0AAV9XM14_9PEZI